MINTFGICIAIFINMLIYLIINMLIYLIIIKIEIQYTMSTEPIWQEKLFKNYLIGLVYKGIYFREYGKI